MNTLHQELTDMHDGPSTQAIKVDVSSQCLTINADGFGAYSESGGAIVMLEFFEGKLELHVYADINKEDATHRIDMSGALENKRIKEG